MALRFDLHSLRSLPTRPLTLLLLLRALTACTDDAAPNDPARLDAGGDGAAAVDPDAGVDPDGGSEPPQPPSFGGLVPDTPREAQDIDLFGTSGHRLWFEVSEEQLARMNLAQGGGGPGPIIDGPLIDGLGRELAADDPLAIALRRDGPIVGGIEGDIYTPGGAATYADQLIVMDAETESVADYGKVETKLVGESTGRTWDFLRIPNVRVDMNEFEHGKELGDFEHFRLNNGLVGTIFREAIAHRVYRELGYPALRASWAFLGSNVWGDDVWVPMTLIEVYKRKFCKDNADLLGGTCENMWEFPGTVGDAAGGVVPDAACQVSECDHTRLEATIDAVAMTPPGAGFKAAIADYIDWDRYHQFQCLSWIMWTGDDPIHGGNNNLIIEREEDGKLIWAPYSIDISAGQDWYTDVSLLGSAPIAAGCQADPECWADTIATCEDLIERFDALNPEKLVDEALETLTELDMLRTGDLQRAEELREWYVERQAELGDELERFRYLPDGNGVCPDGLELCGDGGCGTAEQCVPRSCQLGQTFCDSVQRCVDPEFEPCPICPEDKPLHCNLNGRCVTTPEVCRASCDAMPGQVYCPAYEQCFPEHECPGGGGDEDGGVFEPLPL